MQEAIHRDFEVTERQSSFLGGHGVLINEQQRQSSPDQFWFRAPGASSQSLEQVKLCHSSKEEIDTVLYQYQWLFHPPRTGKASFIIQESVVSVIIPMMKLRAERKWNLGTLEWRQQHVDICHPNNPELRGKLLQLQLGNDSWFCFCGYHTPRP